MSLEVSRPITREESAQVSTTHSVAFTELLLLRGEGLQVRQTWFDSGAHHFPETTRRLLFFSMIPVLFLKCAYGQKDSMKYGSTLDTGERGRWERRSCCAAAVTSTFSLRDLRRDSTALLRRERASGGS